MATIAASGSSSIANTEPAVRESIDRARRTLGEARVTFALLFAGPKHDLAGALTLARELVGNAEVIGCTTAGELTELGLTHGGVAVLLVSSDETSCATSVGRGLKQRWHDLATSVGGAADSVRAAATAIGQRRSTTILLTDGLAGTGEVFVADLVKRMPPGTQIVGGAAGDEGEFVGTRVGIAGNAGEDALAALHVFSRRPWGVGVGHGLRPTTDLMKVTRAEGNVIHEIDGQPAFNIYRAHARARGVALDPKNASRYLIGNELGVHVFDRLDRARAPLFVGDDGSLTCAGTVPQGASVSILDGEVDSMLSAAASAAREARDGLAGGEAAAAVLFDCVCRGMILGDQFKREIDAVREELGNVPVVGFLTYGEIARYPGRSSGWHNATAVVLAIPR